MTGTHSRRAFFDLSAASLLSVAANTLAQTPVISPAKHPQNLAKTPFTSVRDFGAVGDGIADDSRAVQKAYDSLKLTGGTLFFPRGQYRLALELTSRNIHIIGEGRGASILHPVLPGSTIIRALYREGSWDSVTIADLTLQGVGENEGSGFTAGSKTYQKHDEYTGSTFFSRVQFFNFDKCIARPFGSIGLWIDGCQFGAANYHIWSKSTLKGVDRDVMHSGCVVVSRCHMDYFAKAMFYIDSPSGECGQIIFENNIWESGPGFVLYVRSFNSSGGVPGMAFIGNWNENNATAIDLIVEGKRHPKAKFLYAEKATSAIRFVDTPIGDCQLIGSGVETHSCNLQNLTLADADAASTITHNRARMFSGTSIGRVHSIAHPSNTDGLRTPWFRMAVPKGKTSLFSQREVLKLSANQPITLAGRTAIQSVSTPNTGVFGKAPAQSLLVEGPQDMPLANTASIRGAGWVVTSYIYKLLAGPNVTIRITGTKGISGIGDLSAREWEMLVNISKFDFAAPEKITVYHQSESSSKLLVAGIAMVTFDRLQDAVDYTNMGLFPG